VGQREGGVVLQEGQGASSGWRPQGLAEVTKEVNRTRQKLKRAYFSQRLADAMGDARATWEVLGEVLGGGNKGREKGGCRFFRKGDVGLTDKGEIAERFFSQVGQRPRVRKERGAFLDYMGDKVEESLFWRPTTPLEVKELCGALDLHKGMGWDEISPRVIKMVACEIWGPLSRLFNCCLRGGH
jgi:hypothetical protein